MSSYVQLINQQAQIYPWRFPECCRPVAAQRLQWMPYSRRERSTAQMAASCLCWMECQEFPLQACPTGAMLFLGLRVMSWKCSRCRLLSDHCGTSVQVSYHIDKSVNSSINGSTFVWRPEMREWGGTAAVLKKKTQNNLHTTLRKGATAPVFTC